MGLVASDTPGLGGYVVIIGLSVEPDELRDLPDRTDGAGPWLTLSATVRLSVTRLVAVNSESPHEMTTTAEEAVVLGVSEAFVARLIEHGRLRDSLDGSDHAVFLEDLVAYGEARRARFLAVNSIADADADADADAGRRVEIEVDELDGVVVDQEAVDDHASHEDARGDEQPGTGEALDDLGESVEVGSEPLDDRR